MTKILFLSTIQNIQDYSVVSDYQLDVLMHGMSQLPDVEVDCVPFPHWLYFDPGRTPEETRRIWGKGFTLYGNLIKNPEMKDPSETLKKFEEKYYDLVILGVHHTTNDSPRTNNAYLDKIRIHYPKKKIVVVDGWDRTEVNRYLAAGSQYFKRELIPENEDVARPIWFGIPKSLIQKKTPKGHAFAHIVPVNQSWNSEHIKTYIFDDELSYYDSYSHSWFAYTCKKGGWDCLRHHEILMCNCLPWFTDIEKCPPKTLYGYPKDLCIEAKKMTGVNPGTTIPYDPQVETYLGTTQLIKLGEERGDIDFTKFSIDDYISLHTRFSEHMMKHLTTESIAKYLLEQVIQ